MGEKPSDRSNSPTLAMSQLHLDLRDPDVFLMKKDRESKVDHPYVTSVVDHHFRKLYLLYDCVICIKTHNKMRKYYLKMSTATYTQIISTKD